MKNQTKKTGLDYFNMLTEDEKIKFSKNVSLHGDVSFDAYLQQEHKNFLLFIANAFNFDNVEEGIDYWVEISKEERDGISVEDAMAVGFGYESKADMVANVVSKVIKDIIFNEDTDDDAKTGRAYFLSMTKDLQGEYKYEFTNQRTDFKKYMKIKLKDFRTFVMSGFDFNKTEKGREYWVGVSKRDVSDYTSSKSQVDDLLESLGIRKSE